MRITDAQVIVCSPGRNFVTLKVSTEEGIYGLGDATLNGRELAVASYLSDHVIPLLIGRDARRIEDIWQYLYKGAYWRRGPVTMRAIAAVDTALWDIKGKSLEVPLYQLLGGASRDAVLVYGHASGQDIEETVKAVADYLKLGYKAIRAQSGIPGLPSTYGVGRGKMYYEPAEKDSPIENVWSSELYLNFAPRLFERLRQEFGSDLHLLHDAHHRLTPIEAARLGKSLEPFHLFWLEDPVPAELYQVRTGSHGATDLSPVCMAAALHFDLSVHNFGIQEYMRHTDETDRVFPHSYSFSAGMMHPGEAPGLGVDLDETLAAKYPYRRAYLPVNRNRDGTMHSW